MFTIVGAILAIFGFVTRGSAIYARSAGMNINLIWGLVMLVFGGTMLLLGFRAGRRPPERPVQGSDRPHSHS